MIQGRFADDLTVIVTANTHSMSPCVGQKLLYALDLDIFPLNVDAPTIHREIGARRQGVIGKGIGDKRVFDKQYRALDVISAGQYILLRYLISHIAKQ